MIKFLALYFITINIIIDALSFWYPTGGLMAILRLFLLTSFFVYLLIKSKIKFNPLIKIILLFIIYSLIQLLFAEDLYYSIRVTLQILSPFFALIIGYSVVGVYISLNQYLKQYYYVYIIIVGYTFISLVFNIGTSDYTQSNDFTVGGFRDAYNSWTYSLIMFPFFIEVTKSKFKRRISIMNAVIILILLILAMKRIAIFGLVFGFLLFFILSKNKLNNIKFLLMIFLILISLLPLYEKLLIERFTARKDQGRIESNFIETEARYMESMLMLTEVYSLKDPIKNLFGLKAFDSRGAFNLGSGRRQLHVDYNLITYTIGIMGLFLYLMIYYKIFKYYVFLKMLISKRGIDIERFSYLKLVPILLLTSLFTSTAGQMYSISFRTIIFMSIGIALGQVNYTLKNKTIY